MAYNNSKDGATQPTAEQTQLHQQPSAHPSQQQHAQPGGYQAPSFTYHQNHHYQTRPVFAQPHHYPPTMPYSQPINFPQYTAPLINWPATNNYSAPTATPSSQEIPSSTYVSTTPLQKRERKPAKLTDPNTKQEIDIKQLAEDQPSSAKKAPANQSPQTEKQTNPITPVKTNAASTSVTTSSSNDRTGTPSPPSVSNILLQKVSEDTETDKRQAAPTTITTKTTTTTTAASANAKPAIPPSTTTTPATTRKPSPIVPPPEIKPIDEKVEPGVNNVNSDHKSKADKANENSGTDEKDANDKMDDEKVENVQVENRKKDEQNEKTEKDEKRAEEVDEKRADCKSPVEEADIESNNSTGLKEEDVETKDTLIYEPGQYNPFKNRSGRKRYSRQFMVDVCEKICKFNVFDGDKQDNSMDDYSFPQDDPFKPNFANSRTLPHLSNNRQTDTSRRSNHQNYMGRSSAGQEKARKIIAPSSSLTQEVELKTVANPWRPGKEVKEEVPAEVVEVEKVKKSFRSILNKLTPNNFDSLADKVTKLNINTETKLSEVIDIVFAKALAEPGYGVLYGRMCSHLKNTAGTTKFSETLLRRCQCQFQSDIYSGLNIDERKQKIEEETNPDVKKHLSEELYEEMYRCRMRGLGLIKFIGELYKIGMLNNIIMFECMWRLLNDTSEESLECLCDLLVTIGEQLDRSSAPKDSREEKRTPKVQSKANAYQGGKSAASVVASGNAQQQQQQNAVPEAISTLNDIFNQLHKIRKSKDLDISLRIKYKILDVCELREKDNWQSKKKDNNPQKIEEIREAHKEKLERENEKARMNAAPRRSQEGRRPMGHSSGSSSQISSLANDSGNRGASNMHGSASSHAIRDQSVDDKSRQSTESFDLAKKTFLLSSILRRDPKQTNSGSGSLRPSSNLKTTNSMAHRAGDNTNH